MLCLQVRRTMQKTTPPKEDLIPASDMSNKTDCRSSEWMSTDPKDASDSQSNTGVKDYALPRLTTAAVFAVVTVFLSRVQLMH